MRLSFSVSLRLALHATASQQLHQVANWDVFLPHSTALSSHD
jgi:hypothetical protein